MRKFLGVVAVSWWIPVTVLVAWLAGGADAAFAICVILGITAFAMVVTISILYGAYLLSGSSRPFL